MDYYDVTPKRVAKEGIRWAPVVLAIIALFGALQFVMWPLHWWYYGQTVNREARITQQGYSNQTSQVANLQQQVTQIDNITTQIAGTTDAGQKQALVAQRAALGSQACTAWAQLTPTFRLSSGESQWAAVNCAGGVLSPSSPISAGGNQ